MSSPPTTKAYVGLPNNTNMLLRLLAAALNTCTSILFHITNITCSTTWRRVLGNHR